MIQELACEGLFFIPLQATGSCDFVVAAQEKWQEPFLPFSHVRGEGWDGDQRLIKVSKQSQSLF